MPDDTLKTIEELVTRSRLGDQVASASLVVIGREAQKGSARAIEVKKMILEFLKCHPQAFESSQIFGIDVPDKSEVIGDACLLKRNLITGRYSGAGLAVLLMTLGEYSLGVLTHGPTLLMVDGESNPIVDAVRGALVAHHLVQAFDQGNHYSNNPQQVSFLTENMNAEEKKAFQLGMVIGTARRLQAVANPTVPLSVLCVDTAWELGE